MSFFYIWVTVAIIAALAWMLRPLLRKHPMETPERETANLAIFKNQLVELDADRQAGILSNDQYAQAKAELENRVLDEAAPVSLSEAKQGGGRAAALLLAAFIILGSVSLYALIGNPAAMLERAKADAQLSPHQVDEMIAQLAARMEKNPGDPKGWGILARSYYALGRYGESAQAYEQLVKLLPQDAAVLADYADALAMSKDRDLRGQPAELLRRALQLDPNQWKALLLSGSEAFDRADYRGAMSYWERLLPLLPPESELAQQLQAGMDEARSRGKLATAGAANNMKADASAASISGTVSLAPQLKAQVRPDDVLFIFARAAEGSRIPLAVLRMKASQLPATFELSDAQAMRPDMRLSLHDQVVVGARVSKSGNPIAQSGDWEGYSATVKPGARDLKVRIDRQIP